MAKKSNATSSTAGAEMTEQKKRKKLAKQEAKMMLKIEEAKIDIQKAEKKLVKAQATLGARTTQLHALEGDLSDFRATHQEAIANGQPGDSEQETGQHTSADEDKTIVAGAGSNHQSEQPDLTTFT